jgi:DNA repair ATPase RecN
MVSAFVNNSNSFIKKTQDVVYVAKEGLHSNNLEEVALFWEKYWNQLHGDYDALQTDFQSIKRNAVNYFAKIAKYNSNITDADSLVRKADNELNTAKRLEWERFCKDTESKLNNIAKMLEHGDNYKYSIINAASRSKLDANMQEIDKRVKELSATISSSLYLLEEKAKEIFEKKNTI